MQKCPFYTQNALTNGNWTKNAFAYKFNITKIGFKIYLFISVFILFQMVVLVGTLTEVFF